MDILYLVLCVNYKNDELHSFVAFSCDEAEHYKADFLSSVCDPADWGISILRSVEE